MGGSASVARPTTRFKKPPIPVEQQKKDQTQASEVPILMASLQGSMPNTDDEKDEQAKLIRVIELVDGVFPENTPPSIECDDIVEFKIGEKCEYDIFQVYKDGNDYYRINNGYELFNIKSRTPAHDRRILLSIALSPPSTDLYFCIIPSSDRETISKTRKCPKDKCEPNRLTVKKCEIKFSLTDEKDSQKVYLHKGDTIELEWVTKHGNGYRIEEKKYCPISGGLYTVEQAPDNVSNKLSSKGKFSKTFMEFGMSFLFRYSDGNQIHDVTVCVVNDTYRIKHIEINDKNNNQPNLIWIELNDWVVFEWNTKRKQTIVQIEPFTVDENRQQSIELRQPDKHFFWPYEPTRRGHMYHQFNETGVYCYKTGNNQINTIIVEPRKTIQQVSVFGDQLTYKMNTKDLIQFNWKMTDLEGENVLITIDSGSSVVPHAADGLTGVFDCAIHHCGKVEQFFRHHFHTCETFLLNIPQHGLYNFSYSNNRDSNLISVIVENGVDKYHVVYNEKKEFEPSTVIINRFDQVWFETASSIVGSIHQTDEFGNQLANERSLFQPQQNSINHFMKEFDQLGVYYFSLELNNDDTGKTKRILKRPLAVIVLPEVVFHYQNINRNVFNTQPIITTVNDFVIWEFEHIISHNVVSIHPSDKLNDLISCHEEAIAGRNRQCLAAECMKLGTFYFANPEFERVAGLEQERLISTIIIDPPFSKNCFLIANRQFFPYIMYIQENDTVSWVSSDNDQKHLIYVHLSGDGDEDDENNYINLNIAEYVPGVHHLHTFSQPGQYIVKSDLFESTATVQVYSEAAVRSQKKQVQEPRLIDHIDTTSPHGTTIQLDCPNRNATIYYTLDGSTPKRLSNTVYEYKPDQSAVLDEQGLKIIRAYATEDQKIASTVMTSSPTFVLENKELEAMNQLRDLWNTAKVTLTASLQQPNKLFGKIELEPTNLTDFIDRFEIYINDTALKTTLASTDTEFSAEGFAGGEQYEVHVVAYPNDKIVEVESIESNKRAIDIKRITPDGAPLVSLGISKDHNTLLLMWAHIGNHVSEYVVYVDNIETKTIAEQELSDFFGIQFHGAQQRKTYLLHVEAKIKKNNEMRKSNVISVVTPLETTARDPMSDQYFPFITINGEATPSDTRLETIELTNLLQRRPVVNRKIESLPITDGFRNALPTISYKRNPNGITLLWQKKSQAITDSVKNYRIMVDGESYGELIEPNEEPKFQINLSPGKHECYVDVLPKENDEEIFRSNVLKVDIPAPTSAPRHEQKQQKERSDTPVHRVLEQKDIPVPKLNIQTINASSIRMNGYLDRAMPTDAFVAMYDIHIRGQHFPSPMTSDESVQQDGYIEHIWHGVNLPFEVQGISERDEYSVFIEASFHVQGLSDTKYVTTTSNEVKTARVDPLIDLLSRPLLKVTRVGLQMANLSWKLDDSTDQSLVKGYRIVLNSKPGEILSPNQHEYELRNLKPGTLTEIQVSVTTNPDFVDEKISEPIRIVCPERPQPPTIQAIKAEKPFSISIKWKLDSNDRDEITSFKIFLDGKLHGDIETNGRQSFKYDCNKLQDDQNYSIHVKAVIGQRKLDGYVYQCEIDSHASNELILQCATPPKGTPPRLERMDANGVEIVWDAPVEYGDVKLTGYQILKDGRAIGKSLPLDKRQASINNLEIGNRYSLQVVPLTDQPGGTLLRTGEEYDPDRHGHYLPGPKLEVEYTDLIPLPTNFCVENISGHSAMVFWSPPDQSLSKNIRPDAYKLFIWDNKELTRDQPKIVEIPKGKTDVLLKDLQSETTYEIQLEAYQKRKHQITDEEYIVLTKSEILSFETGSPPEAPSNLHLIACTNTDARFGFDQFIEHNAEIKGLRVQCEPLSTETNTKEISDILTPDATEFTLSNLIQRTEYNVTIYGITDEYLNENRYRDVSQLPRKLKPSKWLPSKSLQFQTSGCEAANQINIHQATTESIQLEWTLPKVYGSTEYIGQILRWKLEHGEEDKLELDRNVSKAKIPGPLPSGLYKISLDSLFSVKINLEDDSNEASRKEIRLTTTESIPIRFQVPATCERPELYLTGYTINTIDLAWNKPDMFNIIDHPEKINEQLKIHRRLISYRVDINGKKHNTLDENQYRCTLTECRSGEEYKVQLVAKTVIQKEYMNEIMNNENGNTEEAADTPSKKISIRMLKNDDLLRSFQANFEFNPNEPKENKTKQQNQVESLGKINLNWTVSNTTNISHFILQWRSSKDLHIQQKTIPSNETLSTIDLCDEKHHYVIDLIIVTNDGNRYQYEQLAIPIPGEPDVPKLWLVKTSDTSFTVEWSEPKSYGIPVIGYQLYIAGKKSGDIIEVNLRRANIPSRINRTYHVSVCAITNNPHRTHSMKSETLSVITSPTTNLIPTMYYNNDDGNSTTFDRTIARIIPLQIESVNEEKLHIDWTSFLPTTTIRTYYVHYTCLNNGEVQTMKVSKRFRHAVLRGLRPGFTYGIMIMAADKNGAVLYTSDKSTFQMNAPPNAPIVSISERTSDHVKLEWRPAPSYGEITVVGYKIFVNDRLAAILTHDQLSYTLTNGIPCDTYTVHVQSLSNEKNIVSPLSRGAHFAWPGIKPGAFKRIDDGQTGNIIVAWEHPQLEDEMERLIGFKLYSENTATHSVRFHGEYDAATHQATIYDLHNGKYLLWLEIRSENFCVRSRSLIVTSGRLNSSINRQISFDSPKFLNRKPQRFRSPLASTTSPSLRHTQYS